MQNDARQPTHYPRNACITGGMLEAGLAHPACADSGNDI